MFIIVTDDAIETPMKLIQHRFVKGKDSHFSNFESCSKYELESEARADLISSKENSFIPLKIKDVG